MDMSLHDLVFVCSSKPCTLFRAWIRAGASCAPAFVAVLLDCDDHAEARHFAGQDSGVAPFLFHRYAFLRALRLAAALSGARLRIFTTALRPYPPMSVLLG